MALINNSLSCWLLGYHRKFVFLTDLVYDIFDADVFSMRNLCS